MAPVRPLFQCQVLLGALLSSVVVNAADILFLAGVSPKSHMNFIFPILDGLQSRGHNITVISPFIDSERYPNLPQIELTECKHLFEEATKKVTNEKRRILDPLLSQIKLTFRMVEVFYKHPSIVRILKQKPHYDIIITDSGCNEMVLPIAYHLKSHLVFICTCIPDLWDSYVMNLPTPYAYVPNGIIPVSQKPLFLQRLLNTVVFIVGPILITTRIKLIDYAVAEYLPSAPSFDELRRNVSLMLMNSDPITDSPRPTIPNVILIGGIHCRAPEPLPQYLEDFIQSSGEDGFILFSFGSILKGRSWPNALKRAFVQAFSKLKQKVIWKYEEPVEGLSDNVLLAKWIPQQDLLGHPKIRLFITHGGLLSIQEAIYHGVPIIGVPIFAKQPQHVTRAVEIGIGESLDFNNIKEEEILEKIHLILNHTKYKRAVSRYSAILRDQPEPVKEKAMYWMEYVIRHNGAHHLMTSAKYLSIWQYYLLDVITCLAFIVIILIIICYFLIKCITKFFKSISKHLNSVTLNKKRQ